jgi:hypothetical protein
VVVPPGVAQVALEQLAVALVGERHEDDRVAVGDVPALVGLHRVEDGRQQVVAVGRRLAGIATNRTFVNAVSATIVR